MKKLWIGIVLCVGVGLAIADTTLFDSVHVQHTLQVDGQTSTGTLLVNPAATVGQVDTTTNLSLQTGGISDVVWKLHEALDPPISPLRVFNSWQADFPFTNGPAQLNLATVTLNVDTIVRETAGGAGGNATTLAFVADGIGAGTLNEAGYPNEVFHYQSGTTTIANFNAAVNTSVHLEIQAPGTLANIITAPGDTFAATHLTGGGTTSYIDHNFAPWAWNVSGGGGASQDPTAGAAEEYFESRFFIGALDAMEWHFSFWDKGGHERRWLNADVGQDGSLLNASLNGQVVQFGDGSSPTNQVVIITNPTTPLSAASQVLFGATGHGASVQIASDGAVPLIVENAAQTTTFLEVLPTGTSVGGTLGVSGLATFSNGIDVSNTGTFHNQISVTQLATFHGGATSPEAGAGGNNEAWGAGALPNSTGGNNTALGNGAAASCAGAGCNNATAVGFGAMGLSGGAGNVSSFGLFANAENNGGSPNDAFGVEALFTNSTGVDDAAFGEASLFACTGSFNSAFGISAGGDVTTGQKNTMIGYDTGRGVTTGSFNTIIGASISGLAIGLTHTIILSDGDGDASNMLWINPENPTVDHGTLDPNSTGTWGNVTAVGAFASVTLTFPNGGFPNKAWCQATENTDTIAGQYIRITNSKTAPVFNCLLGGAASNCNDFTYWCTGN